MSNRTAICLGSASNILSIITSSISAAAGDQSSFWGPIGVEYYYHVSPVVGVGAVAAYAGCKAEDEKTHQDDLTETFITVMPSVKFNWLRKKHFGLYSAASAGVLFCSVSWGVFSWGYSIYANVSGKYGAYGILGTLMVIMMWMYYCFMFLLIGGCINAVIERRRAARNAPAEEEHE